MPTVSVPAPIGGWNARDPLDSMPPTDAISLVNWFPQAGAVYGRGGSLTKVSLGTLSNVDTLVPFTSSSGSAILAASGGKIFAVDPVAATSTQKGTGFSVNNWQYGMYNNKAVLVNGTDLPQVYDGSTLSAIVANAAPVTISSVVNAGGGTIGAGLHGYRVSAVIGGKEGIPSNEVTVTNTASQKNTITWSLPNGSVPVDNFKVYGRTSGGELLIATVSGTTFSYVDDGSITPSGAMPSSDATPALFIGTVNMKGRALYWSAAQCGFWYASAGAFQGALFYFPLDYVFREGGAVSLITTWSRDNGDGVDDMTAIISSNGECLVYQGNDPSSALAWQMVGRFHIGVPLSIRAVTKVGSAAIVVTNDGAQSLDEAIANQQTQDSSSFGGKVIRAFNIATTIYRSNFGWDCTFYPRGSMFIANIPINATQFEQYVRNTDTGAWCRFTGWNARSMCVFNTRLYFGTTTGAIVLADTNSYDQNYGFGDDGNPVLKDAQQAYMRFTQPGMKSQITAVQLVTNMYKPTKASINFFADYATRALPNVSAADSFPATYWDQSLWDTFYWGDPDDDPLNQNARPTRHSVMGYGFALSLSFRYNHKKQLLVWYSTNYEFKQAGV
jgi:hypothetical protein